MQDVKVGDKVYVITMRTGVTEVTVCGVEIEQRFGTLIAHDDMEDEYEDISKDGVPGQMSIRFEAYVEEQEGEVVDTLPRQSNAKEEWFLFLNREDAEEAMAILNPVMPAMKDGVVENYLGNDENPEGDCIITPLMHAEEKEADERQRQWIKDNPELAARIEQLKIS